MRILLIRHARQESILCNDNASLCNIGKRQASLLGKRLRNYNIDTIYSSDFIRAIETADIVKKEIGSQQIQIKIREDLRETDFGELTGLYDSDIKVQYQKFMEGRFHVLDDWAYPGGESGSQVFKRASRVLDEIISGESQNVCVVTHGGTIRVLLSGIFMNSQKDRLIFGKYMERGGFTELYYDKAKNRYFLERFNDYAHLEVDKSLLMRKEN